MKFSTCVAFMLFTLPSSFAQSLVLDVAADKSVEDAIKEAVVSLVKKEATLAADYSQSMDKAFSFLDPEDPRRIDAADVANLSEYSLSQWIPSSSFRIGQGDYGYCDMSSELASFTMGTVVVGFDTSYKREETYGFWAVYSYSYDWCETDNEDSTVIKARIRLDHKRWLSEEAVSQILY